MKSIFFILLGFVTMSQAIADVQMPKEYRAELLVNGKLRDVWYISGKNSRVEGSVGDETLHITIHNAQKNVTYVFDSKNKQYDENPYSADELRVGALSDFAIEKVRENEKYKMSRLVQEGTEIVDEQICDVYRQVSLTGYRGETIFWVSKKYGIPIKSVFILENPVTHEMSESKHELFIRPSTQSMSLFDLPESYVKKEYSNMSSIALLGDSFLQSLGHLRQPEKFSTALCGDRKIYQIRYVERHNCNPKQCRDEDNFDRYRFLRDTASNVNCLIGDDDFFRGKSVLDLHNNSFPFDEASRPKCSDALTTALSEAKGLAVKGCWQLGQFEKTGSVNIVEFVPHNGVLTAALAWHDNSRLILNEWTAPQATGEVDSVWRLGDRGVFQPSYYNVLFGFRIDGEIELVVSSFGGEGVTYSLIRSKGNVFVELWNNYLYTNGY
ncbi:MAG: hypothetical protein HOO95_08255 [Gallionella sp.]|nr:hypothetical protein [Gallionella sp.]